MNGDQFVSLDMLAAACVEIFQSLSSGGRDCDNIEIEIIMRINGLRY